MKLKRLSPLRYPGGKAKVLEFIMKVIKENNCIGTEYVEPYAGGAGVALGLLVGGYVSKIHINDIDKGIYCFWEAVLENTELFIEKVVNTEVTVVEWNNQRLINNHQEGYTNLEIGFSTFYLNRCNRSGIIKAGCIGGKNQSGVYKIDARFNKENLIKRIRLIASYKEAIHLYNEDTLVLLKSKREQFNHMILYLDPPYYVKGSSLYRNSYLHKDHQDILDELKSFKGHWIVSYDNTPKIIDIYHHIRSKEFNIMYSAGDKKKGQEIMFFSESLKIPECEVIIK